MTVDTSSRAGAPTRRRFLHTLAAGSIVSPMLASRPAAAQSDPGESYWEEVRRQFAFREERVPMNAANLCPSPRAVAERVGALTRDIDADCSFPNRAKFGPLLEASREAAAAQLGVAADEIALVRNTSEANNVVNAGLPLAEGDEVVVWDQNHPTNNVAWDVRAARHGMAVKRVATPAAPSGVDELVGVFERALTPRTRVLALTHVSNVSGVRLPVRELCDVAHRRGIHVHVDGAQSWGALDVDLRGLGCDSYTGSAHKWFLGPKEVGLLYVRADRVADIWPSIVAPSWGGEVEPRPRGARKFESLGQRDDAALAAVATTVAFHDRLGAAHVEARIVRARDAAEDGARRGRLRARHADGARAQRRRRDRRRRPGPAGSLSDGAVRAARHRRRGHRRTAPLPARLQHPRPRSPRGPRGGGPPRVRIPPRATESN